MLTPAIYHYIIVVDVLRVVWGFKHILVPSLGGGGKEEREREGRREGGKEGGGGGLISLATV